ncbi:MAG: SRPBCC family protein [Flavobacterium sp.]|uniref:SRPBCC family protein n=1 Tax=Flavobacterium sp. TaxID=239 RepID=UPI00121DBF05|nr:SRPBCC family protein [Flavobacterium sp.]RZJ68780.1 MAG: SRPBCC family protein [Flavobacterium sp.]
MMTFAAKNISVSINRPKDSVYEFASDPENFPKWLAFVKSVRKKTDLVWEAETDLGKIEFELVPKNEFGVIDQVVTLPDGTKVDSHLRVIENGSGTEVVFTLFRTPGKTEKEFDDDARAVQTDLETLKIKLEN